MATVFGQTHQVRLFVETGQTRTRDRLVASSGLILTAIAFTIAAVLVSVAVGE